MRPLQELERAGGEVARHLDAEHHLWLAEDSDVVALAVRDGEVLVEQRAAPKAG